MNANDVCFPKKVNFFDAKSSKKYVILIYHNLIIINNRYTTLKRSKLIEFLQNIPSEKIFFNSDLIDIKNQDKYRYNF